MSNMSEYNKTTYELCKANQLSDEEWSAWDQIQASRNDLDSAFFHSQLTHTLANIREDVEVVIIKNQNKTVGFFPFQRVSGGKAQAITGRLSEFHGVISSSNAIWKPEELIRKAGLKAWHFDHIPVSHNELKQHVWGESLSAFMDLREGYDSYRKELKKRGSSLSHTERKSRKLAREIGPLRFEFHSTDDEAFQNLIKWKTAQHDRTGVLKVLEVDWVYQLLDQLRKIQTDSFGGQFSTLHAGDELVAVHLGLRSRSALHIWFPSYNLQYEKYSPGLVLLLEMAKASAEINLKRIDLGRGEERYKANFGTGVIPITEGSVDIRPISGNLHKQWFHTKQWIRSSPYRKQLEIPLTASRKLRQWLAFR